VKVETGIVTLISYRHYLKSVGNNKLWPDIQKESWNIHLTKFLFAPIRWIGPIRNPNWSTSGMRVIIVSRRRAALSIWHQLTQSIQRGESSFQEKCMDFHEIHPRVAYDLAHVCISWSVHTNKWRTTHSALCGYYKFSFRIFIWVYLIFSEYKQ
jgi:hypothetical protein